MNSSNRRPRRLTPEQRRKKTRLTLQRKQIRPRIAALRALMDDAEEKEMRTQKTLTALRSAARLRRVLDGANGNRADILRRVQRSPNRDFLIGAVSSSLAEEEALEHEMRSA